MSARQAVQVLNVPKLVGACVLASIVGVLMAIGSVSAEAGMPFLTLIAGYLLGNGVAARNGTTADPIVGPRGPPDGALSDQAASP